MKSIFIIPFLVFFQFISAQKQEEANYIEKEISVNKWIDGTLLIPRDSIITKPILTILIAGSGPTDRNGNQNFVKNNALKKLAEGLTNNGIATFRYDKRIVKQIKQRQIEKNILFDDFVTDAKDVVSFFNDKNTFESIFIIGHSQGSLVGMLASETNVDGFISLAGPGNNIGKVIVEQITKMSPKLGEETQHIVSQLKKGNIVTDYSTALTSIFNKDNQNFMINWMSYNPTDIIKTLGIPILIINGSKDLQVPASEAKLLNEANKDSSIEIIENMNHVLFEIEGDDLENSKSYNEGFRPISTKLVEVILKFIKN